jgi:mannose-6-phosphate isomerase
MRSSIIALPPNRVRRNYRGGALLDLFVEKRPACDGIQPEDWIASTVRASNPGLPPVVDEGLAFVMDESKGRISLGELFASDPEFYLGRKHFADFGLQVGFLAKMLDSAMRLHVQAHPTAAFAQQHLSSRWGKLETYVILKVRDGCDPFIRLGFQRPPSKNEWRRIILEQDIAAMDACFDPIPVRVGEVWLVPGGLPHAIGPGVLMLEVMEPTDLVVRCEFEREGIIVPPEARFMGRDLDFCLQIFDYTKRSPAEIRADYCIKPQGISQNETRLIGPAQTSSFSISRYKAGGVMVLPAAPTLRVCIVADGKGFLEVAGERLPLHPGCRFLLPAAATEGKITPLEGETVDLLVCAPG